MPPKGKARATTAAHSRTVDAIREQKKMAQATLKQLRGAIKQELTKKLIHACGLFRLGVSAQPIIEHCSMFVQENRRHSRLVKKASKLAIGDLVEIAHMKGMTAPALTASDIGTPVPGSTSGSSSSTGSAGSAGGSVLGAIIATVVSDTGEPAVDADMAELGDVGGGVSE
jgi:hypothetical protein